jgi:large subunit ribosomal protein L18
MRPDEKLRLSELRHWRVRQKLAGTKERPRMAVKFTHQHIYVQFIDDVARCTLAVASSRSKSITANEKIRANAASAKRIGTLAAEAAKSKGISRVVFDRGAARYHGKVKALADAAREAGLQF